MNFKQNLTLLACSQALQSTIIAGSLTTAALASQNLLQAKGYALQWATLPSAILFLAALCSTFFLSWFMAKQGRKYGFYLGSIVGVLGHGLAAIAILQQNFLLFCGSMIGQGIFLASSFYYRFAAMDMAESVVSQSSRSTTEPVLESNVKRQSGSMSAKVRALQAQAVAWVLAGSTLAAFTGPNLANWSAAWLDHGSAQALGVMISPSYLGNYVVYVMLSLVTLVVLSRLTTHDKDSQLLTQKKLTSLEKDQLKKHPVFLTAVIIGLGSYLIMSLIMNATPLAMRHQHSLQATALVIQWHIFAMYAPSFFTGYLINRYQAHYVIKTGLLFCIACIIVNTWSGFVFLPAQSRYLISLFFLGIGWNFLFVSATYLLGQSYTPKTRAYAQGLNDIAVFMAITIATLSAGWLEANVGYHWVNLTALPMVTILWWVIRRLPLSPAAIAVPK